MWTILNSRARVRPWVACAALLGMALSACAPAAVGVNQQGEEVAPDAPQPRPTEVQEELPPFLGSDWLQPVELEAVDVRPLDDALVELAGSAFLEKASNPLVIEVFPKEPLDTTPRTSSPVIVLNGEVLDNTWLLPDERSRLVAFLPDAELIKARNTVEVFWVGNQELTRTKEPLVFTAEEMDLGQ